MTQEFRSPRVRPGFRKWSSVVFLALVPFVVHAVWGYVEMRALNAQLTAIAKKGEPLRVRPYVEIKGPAKTSESYYRAAAALASDFNAPQTLSSRVSEAGRTGAWPALIGELRPAVDRYRDVVDYAERAGSLPFQGFAGFYSYRTSELLTVARLCGYQAIVSAADGNTLAAVAALEAQARMIEPVGSGSGSISLLSQFNAALPFVLTRTHPSKELLVQLSRALADPDGGDDGLRRDLARLRAQLIDDPDSNPTSKARARNWADAVERPFVAHRLNAALRNTTLLVDAASGSWPAQIDRVASAVPESEKPATTMTYSMTTSWPRLAESVARTVGQVLANVRAGRVVVAIETYRRDRREEMPAGLDALVPDYLPAVPVDPFSGRGLTMKKDEGGYVVYSVGADRRDDGGDVAARKFEGRNYYGEGPDIGIRVPSRQ